MTSRRNILHISTARAGARTVFSEDHLVAHIIYVALQQQQSVYNTRDYNWPLRAGPSGGSAIFLNLAVLPNELLMRNVWYDVQVSDLPGYLM